MYKKRLIEKKVLALAQHFKAVLIVGARQVGKSTMLKKLFPTYQHITFDPVQDLYGARQDPDLFLSNFPSPIILDEIQYVPELLPALKRRLDQVGQIGDYLLTGSQTFSMLKNVAESLAGRVAIVQLNGMTLHEIEERAEPHWLASYLEDPYSFAQKMRALKIEKNYSLAYKCIWQGGFPGLLSLPSDLAPSFFSSYVQTYVERDVRLLENIRDLAQFGRFLAIVATLSAQEINHAHLAREIDITPATAQRWLHLIQYSYLWSELASLSGNTLKRITKKGKGIFADTGLACYLQRLSSPEALAGHPLFGALFETYCVTTLQAVANSLLNPPAFYHWRVTSGPEVDCVLERDGMLYPIEFKSSAHVTPAHAKNIDVFSADHSHKKIAPGIILYAGNEIYPLGNRTIAVPFWL